MSTVGSRLRTASHDPTRATRANGLKCRFARFDILMVTAAPAVSSPCLRCGRLLSAPGYCSAACHAAAAVPRPAGHAFFTPPPTSALAPDVVAADDALPDDAFRGDDSESGLSTAIALVFGALVLLVDVGFHHLGARLTNSTDRATEYLEREGTSLDLLFYLLVGAAALALITTRHVHLVFRRGPRVPTIAIGFACGLGAGLALLVLSHVTSGGLATDQRIEEPISEGGFLRIALTIILACVLAPLIEETVFRGILAGSFARRFEQRGIFISAVAFAVWHWMLSVTMLTYYTMLGIGLALLWRRLGLLGSMAAHATFNGILVVTSVILITGPGQTHQLGDISYHLPGGWHSATVQTAGSRVHEVDEGPTSAQIAFDERSNQAGTTPLEALQVIAGVTSQLGGNSATQRMTVTNTRVVQTRAGQLAVADVVAGGQRGELATFVTSTGELWTVLGFGDGSKRSDRDWNSILDSLRWPTTGSTTAA